jgi:hypothetical protein
VEDIKLFPPILENSLPAFYLPSSNSESQISIQLTIPYIDNRAVGSDNYNSFQILIKSIKTD